MTFTIEDFNATCLLKDERPAMIIQINTQVEPFDITVQVPGEPDVRYITLDKFERVNGIITQVRE